MKRAISSRGAVGRSTRDRPAVRLVPRTFPARRPGRRHPRSHRARNRTQHRSRHEPGRGAPPGARQLRQHRTGQGGHARRQGLGVGRAVPAGLPLRAADAAPESAIRERRRLDTGGRDRNEHGDLQCLQCCCRPAAGLSAPGEIGLALHGWYGRRVRHGHRAGLRRLARTRAIVRPDGGLFHSRRHPRLCERRHARPGGDGHGRFLGFFGRGPCCRPRASGGRA